MITRRSFGVLLGAGIAGTALAGSDKRLALVRYTAAVAPDGLLEVRVWLSAPSSEPLSVLQSTGTSPGPTVRARLPGEKKDLVFVPFVERVTRAGPRPVYTTLSQGEELELGPYRFQLPAKSLQEVLISSTLELEGGHQVHLPEQRVALGNS